MLHAVKAGRDVVGGQDNFGGKQATEVGEVAHEPSIGRAA